MSSEPVCLSVAYGFSVISFYVTFTKRKTLAINVHPDISVSVTAPIGAGEQAIKEKVLKRAKWIRRQQRKFGLYPPLLPAPRYISGETFKYVGRQYLLRVERNICSNVRLVGQKILVRSPRLETRVVKNLVDIWFLKRAEIVFKARLEACLCVVKKHGISYKGIIRNKPMKTKWGCCSKSGQITLNPELVGAPKECIDYVILHELIHLKIYNHGPAFYKKLSLVLPDWEERKEKLEMSMEHRSL